MQDKIDKHGITLTRNCDGPVSFIGQPDERAVVEDGRVIELGEAEMFYRGARACRNGGFAAWLDARTAEYTTNQTESGN
jgi:hypothetical protein